MHVLRGATESMIDRGERCASVAPEPERAHRVNLILLYLLCAVGAVGVALAMPRRKANPQILGAIIAAAVGGLAILILGINTFHTVGAGHLPNIYFYIFALVALGGALRVITHQKPVYAALYFILTIIASAGLFLILSAEFMAFALIIVYAGAILITYLFVIMLATQSPDESDSEVLAGYDVESREPILAVVAGFLLLGTLLTLTFRGVATLTPPSPAAVAATANLIREMPKRVEREIREANPELGEFRVLADEDGTPMIDPVARTAMIKLAVPVRPENDDGLRTVQLPGDLSVRNIEHVGFNLLRDHPGTIEIAGVILLMAMLGAVVLSRKQVQIDEDAKARAVRQLQAEAALSPVALGVPAPGAGQHDSANSPRTPEMAAGGRA